MSKRDKIALNRSDELAAIDGELDAALDKLKETSERVDELLTTEEVSAAAATAGERPTEDGDTPVSTDQSDDTAVEQEPAAPADSEPDAAPADE